MTLHHIITGHSFIWIWEERLKRWPTLNDASNYPTLKIGKLGSHKATFAWPCMITNTLSTVRMLMTLPMLIISPHTQPIFCRISTDFQKVLLNFPGHRKARLSIALCRISENRLEEAESALKQLLREKYDDDEILGLAIYNLGVIQDKRAKVEHALVYYQKATRYLKNSQLTHCELRIQSCTHLPARAMQPVVICNLWWVLQ